MKTLFDPKERFKKSRLFKSWRSSYPRFFNFLLSLSTREGLPVALGIFIAAGCWLSFFAIAEDYINGDPLVRADLRLSSFVQTLREPAYNQVMLFLTDLGNWQVIAVGTVVFASLLYVSRQRWWLGAFLTSVLGEQLLSQATKFAFHRERPNLDNALVPAAGSSFPSGHALVAFAFYGFIACYAVSQTKSWVLKAFIIATFTPLILGIGFSRIYLGVHWPSDVMASMALGPALVATVLTVFKLAGHPKTPPSARPMFPWFVVGTVVWLAAALALFLAHPLVAHAPHLPKINYLLVTQIEASLFNNLQRFTEDMWTCDDLIPPP